VLFLDVQFSSDKFTTALKKFAENDKEQMVNNLFIYYAYCCFSLHFASYVNIKTPK